MPQLIRTRALALLVPLAIFGEAISQPAAPDPNLYTPKPSQDLSWAYGDWAANGEHPVKGAIAQWRVKISPGGVFVAELYSVEGDQITLERGKWISTDREVWSFMTFEQNRRLLQFPTQDLYNILVISPSALEFRHMKTGKVLRLERVST